MPALPQDAAPVDVISLDAAYAIVTEMRGVYKNALEASSATNRGLKVAAQVLPPPALRASIPPVALQSVALPMLMLAYRLMMLSLTSMPFLGAQGLETSNQQLRAALAQCATLCTLGAHARHVIVWRGKAFTATHDCSAHTSCSCLEIVFCIFC